MPQRSIRVLLVEDNQGLLDTFSDILQLVGMEVDKAGDAQAAYGLLGQGRYDVAVVDMVLPGPSGAEVVRKLKETSPTTRIIVCTAYYDSIPLQQAIPLGVDKTVQKPVDPGALIALMIELTGQGPGAE